jgi:hypothetical protein
MGNHATTAKITLIRLFALNALALSTMESIANCAQMQLTRSCAVSVPPSFGLAVNASTAAASPQLNPAQFAPAMASSMAFAVYATSPLPHCSAPTVLDMDFIRECARHALPSILQLDARYARDLR